ncbi:MAG: hypothetical protein JXQ90_07795 [Cyclobacteriaceae bacterium]
MLNVRLNKETEKKLADYTQENGISKSTVVKEALALYFRKAQASKTPFELGSDLFGGDGGQNPNASRDYKQLLKKKLSEKHSH